MARKRDVKMYVVDGDGLTDVAVKDVTLTSLTRQDLIRWWGDQEAQNQKSPEKLQGRIATLFRCVEIRAQALSGAPRQLEDLDGNVVAVANFTAPDVDGRLTEEGLPFTADFDDLLWRTEVAQLFRSRAYWHMLRNRVRPVELRYYDPRTITPLYSETAGLTGFERTINGRRPVPLRLEDVAYFHRPGLAELETGAAPGQVAAVAAATQDYLDRFLDAFFEKGATMKTLVFTESDPGPEEKKRIKEYLTRVLTGIGNAFGVEVLSAALKVERLVPPLKELVLPDIRDAKQREICIAMGVPLSLVFSDAANYAVSEQDDDNFYTKTMIPEANFVARQANRLLKRHGLRLVFRFDQMEWYQAREAKKVTQMVQLFDRQAADVDELRQAAGLPPQRATPRQERPSTPAADDDDAPAGEAAAGKLLAQTAVFEAQQAQLERKLDELGQWRRKVLKRHPAPPYAVPFEAEHLTPGEVAIVRQRLLGAATAEEVKAAFAAPFRS